MTFHDRLDRWMQTNPIQLNEPKLASTRIGTPSEQSSGSLEGAPATPPHAPDIQQQQLVLVQRTFRPWAVLIAVVALISVSALGVSHFLNRARYPSTSDAYVEGRVVRISPKVSGQVIA